MKPDRVSLSLFAVLLAISGPAHANDDLGTIADRLARDLDRTSQEMLDAYRGFEKENGGIPIPGGGELTMDDVLEGGPVNLGRSMIEDFGGMMIDGEPVDGPSNGSDKTTVPRFPVESMCERLASRSTNVSGEFTECLESEQEAYNALKPVWGSYPEQLQSACKAAAEARNGSYKALRSCLGPVDEVSTRPSFEY